MGTKNNNFKITSFSLGKHQVKVQRCNAGTGTFFHFGYYNDQMFDAFAYGSAGMINQLLKPP